MDAADQHPAQFAGSGADDYEVDQREDNIWYQFVNQCLNKDLVGEIKQIVSDIKLSELIKKKLQKNIRKTIEEAIGETNRDAKLIEQLTMEISENGFNNLSALIGLFKSRFDQWDLVERKIRSNPKVSKLCQANLVQNPDELLQEMIKDEKTLAKAKMLMQKFCFTELDVILKKELEKRNDIRKHLLT